MKHNSDVDTSVKLVSLIKKIDENISFSSCSGNYGNAKGVPSCQHLKASVFILHPEDLLTHLTVRRNLIQSNKESKDSVTVINSNKNEL